MIPYGNSSTIEDIEQHVLPIELGCLVVTEVYVLWMSERGQRLHGDKASQVVHHFLWYFKRELQAMPYYDEDVFSKLLENRMHTYTLATNNWMEHHSENRPGVNLDVEESLATFCACEGKPPTHHPAFFLAMKAFLSDTIKAVLRHMEEYELS